MAMEKCLIAFIKENKFIYEVSCRSHKYQWKKDQKWAQFAREQNMDVKVLKKRWKTLRDKYFRERRIVNNSSTLETSTWIYFQQLDFLKDSLRDRDSTFAKYKNEDLDSNDFEEFQDYKVETEDPEIVSLCGTIETSNPPVVESSTSNELIDDDVMIINACDEVSPQLDIAKQTFMETNSVETFFKFIALQVQESKLPFSNLSRLQKRVMDVVHEEIFLYKCKEDLE